MDKKRSAIEKSIELGVKSAKKTGDENRARMVKSRQKKLDDRWGIEKSDKGTRGGSSVILHFASSNLVILWADLRKAETWPDFISAVVASSKSKIWTNRPSSPSPTQILCDFLALSSPQTTFPSHTQARQKKF